ncbi:MAG: response regulator transcription factor [Flavobacteriales bacterium]|nr:response regulator transcription factor [Flavobacteriales bacterium]
MRKAINLTVIGASEDINSAICDLLPKRCNSVFSMQKKDLRNKNSEYFNIIEQSEAIIIDLSTSDKKSSYFIKYLNENDIKIPVIALDTFTEKVYADSILDKGASAYLTFSSFADELEDALASVLKKQNYISKSICAQ